jgi:hypothetical protein
MKYALLIYGSRWSRDLPEDEREAVFREYEALFDAPGVVDVIRLHPPEAATTVRLDDGQALLTDGPFVDAKEYLGGLYLIEADNLDAATAIAQKVPTARLGGAVEVRPIVEERPLS